MHKQPIAQRKLYSRGATTLEAVDLHRDNARLLSVSGGKP